MLRANGPSGNYRSNCGAACQAAWRLATATRADWQSARRLPTCPTIRASWNSYLTVAKLRRAAELLCLALPLWAAQPGDIVKGVAGLAVAAHPGAAPHTVLHGSPALVLAVQRDAGGKEWTRVLAADGRSGW